jgi:GT2 family glycosyltransferase
MIIETAIILINYNTSIDTIECISSINNSLYKSYKIYVLDNQSYIKDYENLKNAKKSFQFELIRSEKNLGFSGANNLIIKKVMSEFKYILLLNNDTVVDRDFLNILNEFMLANPNATLATGEIRNYYTKLTDSFGGYIDYVRMSGYPYKRLKSNYPYSISFASGCFQFIRSTFFLEKKIFYEEKYFLYMEDVDFSLKVKKSNSEMFFVPNSIIYHKGSSSTGKRSDKQVYYSIRNRLLFVDENINSFFQRLLFFFFFFFTRLILILYHSNYIPVYILAIKHFLTKKFGKL